MTVGISDYGRARTVAVAIKTTKDADDITTTGHVFSLKVRNGEILDSGRQNRGGGCSKLLGKVELIKSNL